MTNQFSKEHNWVVKSGLRVAARQMVQTVPGEL